MEKVFDVFLSHNSKDKPTVRRLAQALRRRGLRVWLDEDDLIPGRPWQEALENVIETSSSAAVLVGKDGLGPWEVPEMRGCLSEFVSRKMPVIPVLLPGCPRPPSLPLFLKHFTWVDLRDGQTRQGLDGLVWGITSEKPIPAGKTKRKEAVRAAVPDQTQEIEIVIRDDLQSFTEEKEKALTRAVSAFLGVDYDIKIKRRHS